VLPGLHAYSPYGFMKTSPAPALGFCGQHRDPSTGSYPLGNGRRFYNPILMRFQSPDNLSPFGRGGMNAYAYCAGDPVNRTDTAGSFWSTISHAMFGLSAVAGVSNMVVSRMRAIINRVDLPPGRSEPVQPLVHAQVHAVANVLDTYAYTFSAAIRPVHFRAAQDPSLLTAATPGLIGVDVARSTGGFLGFAALPLNARHEWRRAGVRDMHRGRLIAEAVGDAYGITHA